MSFSYFTKIKRNASSHSLVFIGIVLSICSCRSDFETASTGDLTFSKDTIYLDTVFNNGSSTYRLKVYNKSKNDITIPSIKLAKD
jgi:hypothetical protein